MNTELNEILDKRRNAIDDIEEPNFHKIIGNLSPGCRIEIEWLNLDFKDYGYAFVIPGIWQEDDEFDFFFHVPSPDNPGGIGDAPEVFGHIYDLMQNEQVRKINVINK